MRTFTVTAGLSFAVLAAGAALGAGPVVGWGSDEYGQATPPPSVDGTVGTATAIAAGAFHSCAIQSGTGAVVCWGANYVDVNHRQVTPPPSVNGTAGTATAMRRAPSTMARSSPGPAPSSAGGQPI